MPIDPARPDLVASLQLDPYAPRAARHHVRGVDSPSPDLRDAIVLLTSELVTRAVGTSDAGETLQLRVWMPAEVVRVELRVPDRRLFGAAGERTSELGMMVLDQMADRWAIEPLQDAVMLWFEIDRRPRGGR